MSFFDDASPAIYAAKLNLTGIPAGGNPVKYWEKTDANQIRTMVVDTHTQVRGGKFFGLSDQGADPLPGLGAGKSYLYGTAAALRWKDSAAVLRTLLDDKSDIALPTGKSITIGGVFMAGQIVDRLNAAALALPAQVTGDLLVAASSDQYGRLAAVAAGSVLASAGVGVAPAWSSALSLGSLTLTTPLGAPSGGTGFDSYAIGDLLYADTAATLAKLVDVAAGSYLRSGGVGVAPAWSTLKLPNAATQHALVLATASNTWGELATSTGVLTASGAAPAWNASPSLTALTLADDSTVSKNTNGGVHWRVNNPNGGAGAYTAVVIANAAGDGYTSEGMLIAVLGTGYTTSGAFKQDGCCFDAGTGLSGDLSFVSRAANVRLYAGGSADANERIAAIGPTKHVLMSCDTAALADGSHRASSFSVHVNEGGNLLTFKVKYADGTTVKSGTVALV